MSFCTGLFNPLKSEQNKTMKYNFVDKKSSSTRSTYNNIFLKATYHVYIYW